MCVLLLFITQSYSVFFSLFFLPFLPYHFPNFSASFIPHLTFFCTCTSHLSLFFIDLSCLSVCLSICLPACLYPVISDCSIAMFHFLSLSPSLVSSRQFHALTADHSAVSDFMFTLATAYRVSSSVSGDTFNVKRGELQSLLRHQSPPFCLRLSVALLTLDSSALFINHLHVANGAENIRHSLHVRTKVLLIILCLSQAVLFFSSLEALEIASLEIAFSCLLTVLIQKVAIYLHLKKI